MCVCVLCVCPFFLNEKNAVLEIAAINRVFKAITARALHTHIHTLVRIGAPILNLWAERGYIEDGIKGLSRTPRGDSLMLYFPVLQHLIYSMEKRPGGSGHAIILSSQILETPATTTATTKSLNDPERLKEQAAGLRDKSPMPRDCWCWESQTTEAPRARSSHHRSGRRSQA